MKRHLLSAAALVLVASMAQAESTKSAAKGSAKAPALSAGIALEYVEPGVRAQDDFFEYLNGKWLKTVEIPSDKSSWGAFHKLHDDTQPQLRAIIERSAATKNPRAGSEEQLIGDFFASYMDWSHKLDSYSSSDSFGTDGFTSGGQWNFGIQMETWF